MTSEHAFLKRLKRLRYTTMSLIFVVLTPVFFALEDFNDWLFVLGLVTGYLFASKYLFVSNRVGKKHPPQEDA